ncbi:hypothetical protein Tco_0922307 [Tanacetum coccineum]|uniref:Uncharacterized protein n=1 Tax=Tanacetum coccineum TaxID=301880 RepID=A0ABQ5D105_9ASTR
MANLFPPLFPLPPLRQPYTSSCDCSMNIHNAREELHNSVSDDEEEVEPIPKVEKKTDIPTATKKESVKPEKPIRRSLSCPNVYKHMVPKAVLMKTGLKTLNNARHVNTVRSVNTVRPSSTTMSLNTVRPSYTAHPKSTVHYARPRTHFQNQAQSTVNKPFYKKTTLTKRSYNQNVNTVRQNVNTIRARGFNVVKPSACWVWKLIKPNDASLVFNKYNLLDIRKRLGHPVYFTVYYSS